MKKLILEEDELVQEVDENEVQLSGLISTLIKNSWDSIDLYNSISITAGEVGNQEVIDIINDNINNLYINIGQLENALQQVSDKALALDNDLGEVSIPEEEIQVDMG